MQFPVFDMSFSEEDKEFGVNLLSLVDAGAIKSDWISGINLSDQELSLKLAHLKTLSDNEIPVVNDFIALADEDTEDKEKKFYVMGAGLIPNKLILQAAGELLYYITFSEKTVRKSAERYLALKLTDQTNLQHGADGADKSVRIVQSWIVDDPDKDKSTGRGLKDIVKGTWMVIAEVPTKELQLDIISGKYNGFSIEAKMKPTLKTEVTQKLSSIENKKNKFNMSKINEKIDLLVKNIKNILLEESGIEPAKLAVDSYTLKDKDAEGNEVVISVDQETKAATYADGSAVPEGAYVVNDESVLNIDKDGLLVDITPAPEKKEEEKKPAPAEANATSPNTTAKLSGSLYASYTLEDGSQISVNVVEINEVRKYNAETQSNDLLEDGSYPIKDGGEVVVKDGKLVSGPGIQDPSSVTKDGEAAPAEGEPTPEEEAAAAKLEAANVEIARLRKNLELANIELAKKPSNTVAKTIKIMKSEKAEITSNTPTWEKYAALAKETAEE